MGRKKKTSSDCSYHVVPNPAVVTAPTTQSRTSTVITPPATSLISPEIPLTNNNDDTTLGLSITTLLAAPTLFEVPLSHSKEVLHTQPAGTSSYSVTVVTEPVSHSPEVLHTRTVGPCSSVASVTGLVTVPLTYQANHFYPTMNPFSKGLTPMPISLGATSVNYSGQHATRASRRAPRSTAILKFVPTMPHVFPLSPSCKFCKAKRFAHKVPSFCCSSGQVKIAIHDAPDDLWALYTGTDQDAKHLKTFVCTYNNNLAFTSMGVTYDQNMCKRTQGVYTFKAQGQVYHYLNPLKPSGQPPSNLQLYFYDTDNEMANRLHWSDKMNPAIITRLLTILRDNPYCQFFRNLAELPALDTCKIVIRTAPSLDQRVYNAPTSSQVAAIWVESDDGNTTGGRDILVQSKSGSRCAIQFFYGCYDPMQYVLLFPLGEPV